MTTFIKLTAPVCRNCDNFRLAIPRVSGTFYHKTTQRPLPAMTTSTPASLFRKIPALLCAVFLPAILVNPAGAQTYFNMSSGDYTENFASITNTNVWVTPSTGSWQGLPTNATGSIPSATRITAATTNFVTGASGGAQRGTNGTLQLLASGTTDNTSSTALDLLLNFAGRNAGNLGFDAAQVANGSGNRVGTLRAYYTTNGTTWSELTGGGLPFAATNNVASSNPVSVSLPAAINNSPTVQLRFYYNNGTGGSTGSRPKISIDNVLVTSTPGSTAPSITSFSPASGFAGDTITINGFNFGATPAVLFNGVAASSTVNPAGTQITATVPSLATTGPITVEVAGEPTATSSTSFTVLVPGAPLINLSTNTISGLTTSTGAASTATNYTVTGTNLGVTPISVAPDSALVEIGTNGTDFTNSLSLTPVGGVVSNSIFLRIAATNVVTNFSAAISHVSGSASNSLAVSGSVTAPVAVLAVSTNTLSGFTTTTNVPSAAQTFTVTGTNLTTNVTVTAPGGFEVASDGVTFGTNASIAPVSGIANTEVSVRLAAGILAGPRSGNVTVASTGATSRTVAVGGSVAVPNIPGLVYWNFDTATPTSGTGGDYATWTFPAVTQNNNNGTTVLLTTTSPSSGYTNPFNVLASGTTNAGASARTGAFNAASNAFFEVQIVVPTSTTTSITNISFGSRSTGTGPAAYSVRSSVDNFAADVATNALATNSTWGMYVAPVAIALSNGTNVVRIYGYNGTGSPSANTANWRIDDLTLALSAGTGPTPPSGLSYTPSSVNGVVGAAVTNMVPSVTGTVTNYSVSPALPTGISIDSTTGVISGTPTVAASSASYTVTASNAGGSTTADVTIAVASAYDAWAASYSLSGPDALPAADPDKDGLNNNSEFAFGTNPTVANATSLSLSAVTAGDTTISWIERNSGFIYNVQSTTNLATTAFANDGSITPTTSVDQSGVPSGYTRKQFTVTASNNKFFRVRATPN